MIMHFSSVFRILLKANQLDRQPGILYANMRSKESNNRRYSAVSKPECLDLTFLSHLSFWLNIRKY